MPEQLLTMSRSFHPFFTKYYILLLVLIISAIVFSQGWRVPDPDYPRDLQLLTHLHASVPAYKGYLFEGLLGDLIGMLYLSFGIAPAIAQYLWWATGITLLIIVLATKVRYGSLDVIDLLLLVTFTRLIDTLSLFVGKFDPFLIAALVMSSNKNTITAIIGVMVAALLHPFVTILSTIGIVIVRATFEHRWFYSAVVAALIVSAIDLALFHYLFPSLSNRGQFINDYLYSILKLGARWGFITFVGSILVPFLMCAYFKNIRPVPNKRYGFLLAAWLLTIVILPCLLTSDHTRVACLLTFAPAIVFLQSQQWRDARGRGDSDLTLVFVVFFAARVVIPHVDYEGLQLAGGCTRCFPVAAIWSMFNGK